MIDKTKPSLNINEHSFYELSKHFEYEEIFDTINNIPLDKAPGPDGLTGRFFKHFKQEWTPILFHAFAEINEKGKSPRCFHDANICLIRKKATPAEGTDPRDWRPISLTNTIYKIFTKIWATKFANILNKIIGPHQTGFIPTRDIRENIVTIQALIEDAAENDRNCALLFIDWEKAFDRLAHKTLHRVLKKLEAPNLFRNAIKAIYRNCWSRINLNNHLTAPFQIRSGVRQGCPLSPLLFVFVNELLHGNITNDKSIKGYKINQKLSIVNSGYADDTALAITTENDAKRIMHHIKRFCEATAAKINLKKSTVMTTGNWSRIGYVPEPLQEMETAQISKGERYLGLWVGQNLDRNTELKRIVNNIRTALKKWKRAPLSPMGKEMIINTIALSKLWFIAGIIRIPNETIKQVEKLLRSFLKGKHKSHKIALKLATTPRTMGGLGVHNIANKNTALLAKWIVKWKSQNNKKEQAWHILLTRYLETQRRALHPLLWDPKSFDKIKNKSIFHNITHAWTKIAYRTPTLKVGDWVATIRGSKATNPAKITSIRSNQVTTKPYSNITTGTNTQITERKNALIKVDITVSKAKRIKKIELPDKDSQLEQSNLGPVDPHTVNETLYLRATLRGSNPTKNRWHIEKIKLPGEYTSFYFKWVNHKIESRKTNHEGLKEMRCPLCLNHFENAEHALFNFKSSAITTSCTTLPLNQEENTKKTIARAIGRGSRKETHRANLTIITLAERYKCFWASRFANKPLTEEYSIKLKAITNLLEDIFQKKEKERKRRKEIRTSL